MSYYKPLLLFYSEAEQVNVGSCISYDICFFYPPVPYEWCIVHSVIVTKLGAAKQ